MRISDRDLSTNELFVGIDVHKKTYHVTVVDGRSVKIWSFSTPAVPQGLVSHLKRRFPDAQIQSAYEAGFCGFGLHRTLKTSGIDNIVVNPAKVPTINDPVKTDQRETVL